jgi:preprotein translocase, SecE subunit, bacterial
MAKGKFKNYFKGVVWEMKHVSWPSRAQALQSTKVVIISTIVFALVLGIVDYLLVKGIFFLF